MATELCWEPKSDGRYCKNYRLRNKSKCHVHYEYVSDYFTLKFLVILMLSISGYIMYIENTEFVDMTMMITIEQFYLFRDWVMLLYKDYKTIIPLYLNTFLIIVSKMKLY